MVGGLDCVSSNYNRATQAVRQPGSAFKLFVYLAALEAGYTPETAVVDEPVEINGWKPRNSSRHFNGQINIRPAFPSSLNTIATTLGLEFVFPTVPATSRRFVHTPPP